MHIRSILVVPPDALVDFRRNSGFFSPVVEPLRQLRQYMTPQSAPYDGEVLFYGDMPVVLGRDRVFQFGPYVSHLHFERVPDSSPCPSVYGTPRATVIMRPEMADVLGSVDAVLVSTRAGDRRDFVIQASRQRGIPIALLDFQDHHSNYGASDIRRELTYDFVPKRDYDL